MDIFLRHIVDVKRKTTSANSEYEVVASWSTVASSVKADIQPAGGSYDQRTYGNEESALFKGYFPAGTNILAGDRVVFNSKSYEVKYVADRRGHHLEADLVQVSG